MEPRKDPWKAQFGQRLTNYKPEDIDDERFLAALNELPPPGSEKSVWQRVGIATGVFLCLLLLYILWPANESPVESGTRLSSGKAVESTAFPQHKPRPAGSPSPVTVEKVTLPEKAVGQASGYTSPNTAPLHYSVTAPFSEVSPAVSSQKSVRKKQKNTGVALDGRFGVAEQVYSARNTENIVAVPTRRRNTFTRPERSETPERHEQNTTTLVAASPDRQVNFLPITAAWQSLPVRFRKRQLVFTSSLSRRMSTSPAVNRRESLQFYVRYNPALQFYTFQPNANDNQVLESIQLLNGQGRWGWQTEAGTIFPLSGKRFLRVGLSYHHARQTVFTRRRTGSFLMDNLATTTIPKEEILKDTLHLSSNHVGVSGEFMFEIMNLRETRLYGIGGGVISGSPKGSLALQLNGRIGLGASRPLTSNLRIQGELSMQEVLLRQQVPTHTLLTLRPRNIGLHVGFVWHPARR